MSTVVLTALQYRYSTVTAPFQYRHSAVTAPSQYRYSTVTLQVSTLVLNEGEGGDYRSTGPNFAPATPGERSCTGYQAQGVTGHGANVTVSGIDVQHGQSARLGSSPARPLHLLRARLAAPCSSALPGRGPATGRPAAASGARASRLQSRRFSCL